MANKYYRVTGKAVFTANGSGEEKNVATIEITSEQLKKLLDAGVVEDEGSKNFESTPIKVDGETGKIVLKTGSKFTVDMYDDGELLSEDDVEEKGFTLDGIGEGSTIQLSFSVGETKYKGKKFQVCHLKAVNIIDLIPYEKKNPFLTEDAVEI